jgi:phage head maturation protease
MHGQIILKGIVNKADINDQERTFGAWASVAIIDKQGDYIGIEEFKPALEKIMSSGRRISINDSHTNHVCGFVKSYSFKTEPISGKEGIYIIAKIYSDYDTDTAIWENIKNGTYTGISLGGKAGSKEFVCNESQCYNILKDIEIWEFSVVEQPANQSALISEVNKLAKSLRFSKDDSKRIGDKLNIDWNKINIDEFQRGLEIELEHGKKNPQTNITDDDEILTGKIALAHLNEFHNYYSKKEGLSKLENELQKVHVYVKTPSEAPSGSQIYTGEKGGKYYETEEITNRTQREKIEREQIKPQIKPQIKVKSLKEVIGDEKYDNMDKYEVTRKLKNLLNTYSKIATGTASETEINESFEVIKTGLPEIYNFYHFIGDEPKNKFEVAHKKVSDNIEKLQTMFNEAKDKKDKSIAIDSFINTAHVFGDNIILRLWRNFDTWSKEISSFMDVPQKYLDYLRTNIGKFFNIQKAKVYVKNPSEAPKGAKLQEGERGGHYYESGQIESVDEISNLQNNKINNLLSESEKTEDVNKLVEISKSLALEISQGRIKELKLYTDSQNNLGHFVEGIVFVEPNTYKSSTVAWNPAPIGKDPVLDGHYLKSSRKIPQMVETTIHEAFHQRFINNAVSGHNAIKKLKNINYGGDEFEGLIRLATFYIIAPEQLKNESSEQYKIIQEWLSESNINKGFLNRVENYLSDLGSFTQHEFVETHWKPNSHPKSEWSNHIKDLWHKKDKEYDEMQRKLPIKKAKVYVKNPSEAPQGVKLQEGKRGGHYYESEGQDQESDKELEIKNNVETIITDSLKFFKIMAITDDEDVKEAIPISSQYIRNLIKDRKIDLSNNTLNLLPLYMADAFAFVLANDPNNIYLSATTDDEYNKWNETLKNDLKSYKYNEDELNFNVDDKKAATIIHEVGHTKVHKFINLKDIKTQNDFQKIEYNKFKEYANYLYKYYGVDLNVVYNQLDEMLAEDYRQLIGGTQAKIPNRYLSPVDTVNSDRYKYKEGRLNILRNIGVF